LTVGETVTHADNLDGGPRLAGRGLDAAFVERVGRGPMRWAGELGEHRAQRLGPLDRLGLKLDTLVTQTADDDAASFGRCERILGPARDERLLLSAAEMCSRTEIRVNSRLGRENGTLCFISPDRTLIMEDCPNRACTVISRYLDSKDELTMARNKIQAIAYLRTSSPTNANKGLSTDKDSDQRQRTAVAGFAAANGYQIVAEFHDVVSGADPIGEREGFKAMLDRIAGNGVRVILVESPDRFARDLVVQLAGHDYLRSLGIELVPASAPDFFTQDTPTAVLVRQVLGAISQFEKTSLVAKLKAARDRKKAATGKCEGRKSWVEKSPELVTMVKRLHRQHLSLREISAELAKLGLANERGVEFSASSIASMLGG
jgi:DNA invertase Pin-like site-specific DNA recombinase